MAPKEKPAVEPEDVTTIESSDVGSLNSVLGSDTQGADGKGVDSNPTPIATSDDPDAEGNPVPTDPPTPVGTIPGDGTPDPGVDPNVPGSTQLDNVDDDSHRDDNIAGPEMSPEAMDARHEATTPEDVFPDVDGSNPDTNAFIREEIAKGTMTVARARNFRDDISNRLLALAEGAGADYASAVSFDTYLRDNDPDYQPVQGLDFGTGS